MKQRQPAILSENKGLLPLTPSTLTVQCQLAVDGKICLLVCLFWKIDVSILRSGRLFICIGQRSPAGNIQGQQLRCQSNFNEGTSF